MTETQVRILVPGERAMVGLLGTRDELLKLIEQGFDTRILVRGNEVTITGEPSEAERVAHLFEELIVLLDQGHVLTPESVGRSIDMVRGGTGRPSQVLTDAVLRTRGKAIRPKTVGQKRYVDAIRDNTIVFSIGPAGTGKCIAGDSLILSDRGMVYIQDVADVEEKNDQYSPASVVVHGIDGPEPASHVYFGGISETLRITTRLGYSITATPEHPLLVLKQGCDLAWERSDSLKTGDVIALQRGQRMFGNETNVVFAYEPKNEAMDRSRPINLKEINEEMAYFLGLLTGDGCLTAGNQARISSADQEIVDAFYWTSDFMGLHAFPNFTATQKNDHVIGSSQLYQLLQQLGMTNGKAPTKSIPHFILSSPEPIVAAYLRGLFDTDGSVERRDGRIAFFTTSETLARQVQVVLLNFGIVSNRFKKKTRYNGSTRLSDQLAITGKDADLFQKLIGFGLSRKRALLKDGPRNPNVDVIPFLGGLITGAARSTTLNRALHKSLWDYRIDRRRPSYAKLGQMLTVLDDHGAKGPELERLRELHQRQLLFLPIVSVEPTHSRVYDLTVPGSHSFVANGFVNHNTYMAVAAAIHAFQEKQVRRIVLTRPAIEAGERLGFLPGDIAAKVDPYLRPLYDALYEMLEPEAYARAMERGSIEVAPLAYMRGRTLNDAFIILDEAQNTTAEQMKMFLTRLGFGSKAVVTGDITQIDLSRGQKSGLVLVQEILKGIKGVDFVYLHAEDVVRHKIVMQIVEAYRRFAEPEETAIPPEEGTRP